MDFNKKIPTGAFRTFQFYTLAFLASILPSTQVQLKTLAYNSIIVTHSFSITFITFNITIYRLQSVNPDKNIGILSEMPDPDLVYTIIASLSTKKRGRINKKTVKGTPNTTPAFIYNLPSVSMSIFYSFSVIPFNLFLGLLDIDCQISFAI